MAKFSAIVEIVADDGPDAKLKLEAVDGVFHVYSIDELDEEDDSLTDDDDDE